ncbi:GroES-like protein [Thozetella sp. PMI_491]|nr:GroES-like protein [Thozetella sp. PMI_491]
MVEVNRAFVLQAMNVTAFEDREIPKLRDENDVRIHIEQTGICGSDLHYWKEGRIAQFVVEKPMIQGHESSGTVVEAGSKVTNVAVGDRVAIEPSVPCRSCWYCRSGDYNICPHLIAPSTPPYDGTLQKYFIAASDFCYKLPPHLTAEDGALVEPLAVAMQAVKTANFKGNQTVLVFGCGPIGVLCQAVVKAYGAKKVVGVDISASRTEFARSFAADQVFVTQSSPPGMEGSKALAEKILADCGLDDGADVVLECTGAEPCIQAGVFATRSIGTFVQVGLGPDNVSFPITTVLIKALNIKGAARYSTGCYPAAVDLIASGKVKAKGLISHRFPFEQALEAFETFGKGEQGTMKVLIQGVP